MYSYLYQSLILQSGLQAHGIFHGGLSVDVSADLAFSLFTQESKTSVNNKYVKLSVCITITLSFLFLTSIYNDPYMNFSWGVY